MKLYRTGRRTINPVDVEDALGLGTLFSTQAEVSELQALQSQIRPHFLFNALNTVTSLIRTKPQRARELLISLGELLRRSLKKPETRISLDEEMRYIRSYLEIEKARFGEKLTIDYAIDAPSATLLPPLTLQPIIENAVKHGIGARLQGGTIRISAVPEGDTVRFEVRDDGIGMSAGTIERVIQRRNGGDSIGLHNVNERLEYLYGSGLDIVSIPEQGTTVSFLIPAGAAESIGA